MIQWRYGQMSLCDGFWAREVDDLWPAWMRVADRLLEDEEPIEPVYEAQGKRWGQIRTRGRKQTPAEVVLRMLVLKHANNWSFEETEHRVRANVVCRQFARVGLERVPDAKVIAKIARMMGPEVVERIHRRIIEVAKQEGAVKGRRMRVDTTVVETNIHYPTDSSRLGDGARVLTRLMKKVESAVGGLVEGVRNRMRTVEKKVVAIAIGSRRETAVAGNGNHGRADQAGDSPDQGPDFRREHEGAGQGLKQVRAAHRGDPKGQGEQAYRVRQDGRDPGGGKPGDRRLRGICGEAERFRPAGGVGGTAHRKDG